MRTFTVHWQHWNPFAREWEPHEKRFEYASDAELFVEKIRPNWSVTDIRTEVEEE